ncbi:hypothetical protein [Nocardia brasiliensis]|uniref:hypothetical protein n=1 Tax=Nocardia brasiliensis TaxID=37326 RepID=UPI002455B5D8|nr:hypothetical protein [Nocardia brasiliensis]
MNRFETPRQTWTRTLTWIACTLGPLLLAGYLVNGNAGATAIIMLFVAAPIAVVVLLVVVLVRAAGSKRRAPVPAGPPLPARHGPPPGWYPDRAGGQRWFDGRQFTDFTR